LVWRDVSITDRMRATMPSFHSERPRDLEIAELSRQCRVGEHWKSRFRSAVPATTAVGAREPVTSSGPMTRQSCFQPRALGLVSATDGLWIAIRSPESGQSSPEMVISAAENFVQMLPKSAVIPFLAVLKFDVCRQSSWRCKRWALGLRLSHPNRVVNFSLTTLPGDADALPVRCARPGEVRPRRSGGSRINHAR